MVTHLICKRAKKTILSRLDNYFCVTFKKKLETSDQFKNGATPKSQMSRNYKNTFYGNETTKFN
jgi:hypothetical protein